MTFAGLEFSRTLIALLPSYLFFAPDYFKIGPCLGTCLDLAGARFGLGLAPEFLCLLILSPPEGPRALNQVDLTRLDGFQFWVWDWLDASSFPQMAP